MGRLKQKIFQSDIYTRCYLSFRLKSILILIKVELLYPKYTTFTEQLRIDIERTAYLK